MAFINLTRVDIACPVCGNGFLVGADDEKMQGWPYLIHLPYAVHKESVEPSEFTCPFLLRPIPLDYTCPDLKGDSLGFYVKALATDNFIDADKHVANANVASSVDLLRRLIKQYSRMMKLNGTTCNYCGDKFEFSYGFNKNTNEFSCNFMCSCMSVEGAEDLSRLALEFGKEYRKHDKNMDYIEAVISRMPKGAKMLGTSLLYA